VIECEEQIARIADLLADAFGMTEDEDLVTALETLSEAATDAVDTLVEGTEDREVAESRLRRHVSAIMEALKEYEQYEFGVEDEDEDEDEDEGND
jgi:hypothetical protein